jgi:hypothetical protein
MSHFTVLVIGDDIEKQLAPYNEQPEENDEACKPHMSWDGEDAKGNSYSGDSKEDIEAQAKAAGQTITEAYCGNCQSKWDWYVIGGRWRGFFKLKPDAEGIRGTHYAGEAAPEGTADQALKSAIDFEGMFKDAEEAAIKRWESAMKIFGEEPENESHADMRGRLKAPHIEDDEIRAKYWKQPRCILWNEARTEMADDFPFQGWSASPDDFLTTKEKYVENAKGGVIAPYAMLKDGEWVGKGEMGWFGMSNDTVEEADWNARVKELIDELPDDTQLTLVDCHV